MWCLQLFDLLVDSSCKLIHQISWYEQWWSFETTQIQQTSSMYEEHAHDWIIQQFDGFDAADASLVQIQFQ